MKSVYLLTIVLLLAVAACKKDSYLTDDGIHHAEVDQSTYDYLASHPHGMFDTLLLVIDHLGLKAEINNATTFWAPTNHSIKRYFEIREAMVQSEDESASFTFDDFLAELNVDSVRAYINTEGQHSLQSANTGYTFLNDAGGLGGFAYHKQKQPQGQWSYQDVYYLYLVKVREEPDQIAPDGSVRIDRNDIADLRVRCQTSGIKTASGTLLNVLANTHTFLLEFGEVVDSGPTVEDIDGGGIRFTYDLSFKVADAYVGTSVVASSAWIAEAFSIQPEEVSSLYNSSILFYAIDSQGSLDNNYTANAPGHWFDRNGDVINWGDNAALFSEYNPDTFTFSIGQFPSRLAVGDQYTIKQALVYTNRNNQQLRTEFIFNITLN